MFVVVVAAAAAVDFVVVDIRQEQQTNFVSDHERTRVCETSPRVTDGVDASRDGFDMSSRMNEDTYVSCRTSKRT